MDLKKKQNLIMIIAIIGIVSIFSITNYLNKQKVYILSEDSRQEVMDVNMDVNMDVKASAFQENNKIEAGTEKIVIHIEGQVINPGVYELDKDSRVFDAIEAAGGLGEKADRRKINLAKKIMDEEYIYIPDVNEKDEGIEKTINLPVAHSNSQSTSLVNINTANVGELTTLPGIGEVIANRIIEYRSENGKFNTVEDLKNVSGIGDKKFNDIKDKVTVR